MQLYKFVYGLDIKQANMVISNECCYNTRQFVRLMIQFLILVATGIFLGLASSWIRSDSDSDSDSKSDSNSDSNSNLNRKYQFHNPSPSSSLSLSLSLCKVGSLMYDVVNLSVSQSLYLYLCICLIL